MSPQARRAVGLLLLGVVIAIGCTFAGRWQWNRHVARDAVIATVEANYGADPVPLEDVLDGPGDELPVGDVWTPVTASGRYAADGTVLLRNRPVGGTPSFHVLAPFVLDGGEVLVVDRGWVPTGSDGQGPAAVPAPPAGDVTVTVHLRRDEPPSDRAAPDGQVQAISVAQVLAAGGTGLDPADAYAAYGALGSEDPAPADAIGPLPAPDTDPGSHLSYAFQWWTFALGALVGFAVLARRELRGDAVPTTGDGAPAGPPPPRRRRPSAEDEEDALIDSQLG